MCARAAAERLLLEPGSDSLLVSSKGQWAGCALSTLEVATSSATILNQISIPCLAQHSRPIEQGRPPHLHGGGGHLLGRHVGQGHLNHAVQADAHEAAPNKV